MSAADIARKAVDALNRKDIEDFASLYAPDAVAYDPMYPEPLKGIDAIKQDMNSLLRAFPDAQFRISGLNFLGDTIAISIAMTGTNTEPLETPQGEIPPTNRSIDFHATMNSKLNSEEKIVEERRFYDVAALMKQLGVES